MGESITHSIIVKGNVADVYRAWANFEDFPAFMEHVEAVEPTAYNNHHWVMEGPMGKKLEWHTEITRMDENQRIAWRTLEGDVQTSGQVTFTDLPHNETQITLMYHYEPPAGKLGEVGAKLFGDPDKRVIEDLRNFKKFFEGMYDRLSSDN